MSLPTASEKKRPWVATPIATSQGTQSSSISGTPQPGRSARSQGARRSATARVMPVSSGTMGPIGPLSRMPAPSASQKPAACRGVKVPGER
ncbi:hypothetical protein ROTAS13_04620 [Roseomonas sp. TAS13]|nr:hypothetical protein ROTAS13_04620 [Roseomonas sp. TAS13]